MKSIKETHVTLTTRGLLPAVLAAFALFLAYRFLAEVATTALLIAAGLLAAVALSAPVEALHRRKVPRAASVALIVLVAGALLGLGAYLLLPVLRDQATDLIFAIPAALSQLVERAREFARGLGLNIGGGEGIRTSTLVTWGRRLLGGAIGVLTGVLSSLLGLVVVFFVPLYLAAMPEPVVGWAVRLFPPEKRDGARTLLSETRQSLLGWLGGRLISMAITGALSLAALYAIGVPGALFLALFTGLVCFIPLIGPIISAVPPLVLAFAGNPWDALWVLLAYVAIQQVESNLLTPLVMQRTASLHPAVVITSVTVAGAAFGILGALLAVPACVVGGVLVDRLWFERLEAGSDAPSS